MVDVDSFICPLILLLIAFIPVYLIGKNRGLRPLQIIGERFQGTVHNASIFRSARLVFSYGEAKITVRYIGGSFIRLWRKTQIDIATPFEMAPLAAMTERFHRVFTFLPATWQSGDEKFDARFTVKMIGDAKFSPSITQFENREELPPSPLAINQLNQTVRWKLIAMNRNLPQGFLFQLTPYKINITTAGKLRNVTILDDHVRLALEIYDQLLIACSHGVEYTDDNAHVMDDCICPICSGEVGDDMVVCIRCKTPHCHDCWNYNGKCAMFACGETRFKQV